MITEDYVSFKTAKLLKEKGFDEVCWSAYEIITNEHEVEQCSLSMWGKLNQVKCPTLQMAMKWLREVHGLFIGIDYVNIAGLGFTYQTTMLRKGEDYSYCLYKKHYEEACEAAIKYCLENLI